MTIYEIESTTERVVALPTPSAPPVTEKPLLTPTKVIIKAKRRLLNIPCITSATAKADNGPIDISIETQTDFNTCIYSAA